MTSHLSREVVGRTAYAAIRSSAHRARRFILLLLVLLAGGHGAYAANTGYGDLGSSYDVYAWSAHLLNNSGSTHAVTSILLDSSSSTYATPWFWAASGPVLDSGSLNGLTSFSGNGTQQLLLGFSGDPIEPGNFAWFSSIFPDDGISGSPLIPSSAVLGATATFTFSDSSTWTGVFTSIPPEPGNPFPGGLYTLRAPSTVPEPASLALAAMSMALLTLFRRRARTLQR